jgi:uncharacterized protein YjcR
LDWKRIRADYIAGGISYRKLAEKYGVSFNTLKTRATEEQWYRLRQQKDHKTTTKVIESLSDKESKIDDKYFRLVDKLLDKAEETIDDVDKWHPTLLKEMATTMKYLKECKGIKSEADMREQEARIEKLRREAEKDDAPEDREVNVIFMGDIEQYSK